MLPFNTIPEAHILLFLFLKSPEVGWNAYFFYFMCVLDVESLSKEIATELEFLSL